MHDGFVTVIGSYNVGLFYQGTQLPGVGETVIGDRWWEGPGGKGSNQAIAARAFGARTQFIARIGNDRYGEDALALYRRFGIDTTTLRVDSVEGTGISVIFVDRNGRNMIVVCPGANHALSEEDIEAAEPAIRRSAIVGFQLENRVDIIAYGIGKAHALGVTTLLDPAPARELPAALYPSIDIIKPNETEATMLTGIPVHDVATASEAAHILLKRGVGLAIVTLGEQGAVVAGPNGCRHYPAPKVQSVDSTGAGDVFCGALMSALSGGSKIEEAVVLANCAGALSTTRLGVIDAIPAWAEVAELARTGMVVA